MNREDEGEYVLELTLTYLRPVEGATYPAQETVHRVVYRTTCAEGEMRFRTAAMTIVLGEEKPK